MHSLQVAEAITSAHTAGRMHFFTNELMHSLQEAEASTSAHTAEKAAQGKYISALEVMPLILFNCQTCHLHRRVMVNGQWLKVKWFMVYG